MEANGLIQWRGVQRRENPGAKGRANGFPTAALGALCFCFVISCSHVLLAQKAQFGINVPMRDGLQLSTDVWMPAEAGQHPAILVRTPYGKTNSFNGLNLESLG